MKKNKFTEFFKGKGYYVLLFVGVIAIAAVALIGSTLTTDQKNQDGNYVDLNDSNNNIAAGDKNNQTANNNQASGDVANKAQAGTSTNDVATKDNNQKVASNEGVELEGYGDEVAKAKAEAENAKAAADVAKGKQQMDKAQAQAKKVEPAVAASAKTVQADFAKAIKNLSFKADDGLLWPVSGNVIMKYSMDHTIYHATLMQYKCNPAIIIGAKEGTKVKAAAVGIVEKIDTDNEETGCTVTLNIGDDYRLVYGQLKDVKLKAGDKVNAGDVIGSVAKPTKYYSVEGSNLYFEVMKKDAAVNPMLLLRDNEQ